MKASQKLLPVALFLGARPWQPRPRGTKPEHRADASMDQTGAQRQVLLRGSQSHASGSHPGRVVFPRWHLGHHRLCGVSSRGLVQALC